MRPRFLTPAIVLLASLASSCTTSISSRVSRPEATSTEVLSGFTYTLPFAQFDIQTVRTLTSCPGVDGAANYAFSLEATSTRRFAAGAHVTLDYTALSAPTKTTTFATAQHENGMLSSVNAVADDRTGPIVENVVTGIARIALATAGVAPPVVAVGAGPCAILKEAKEVAAEIETHTDKVKEARTAVEQLEAFREARGQLDDVRAQQLVDARNTLETETQELSDLVDRYKRLIAQITVRSTYIWPTNPEASAEVLPLPPIEAEFARSVVDNDATLYAELEPQMRLIAVMTGPGGRTTPASFDSLTGARAGPVYITPAQGRLRLCRTNRRVQTTEHCRTVGTPDVLLEQWTNLPQFGRFVELPLSNGPFENNSLVATFREDGSLVNATFQSQRAAAEAAATTFANVANTIQATTAQMEAADAASDAAAAQAELTDLQRQHSILQTQIAIERLRAENQSPGELARLQAELQILEATIALERRRREHEAAGNP